MELISEIWNYAWAFIVVLTVVVFFHEMGHYLVARANRVRVQTFSIGFGPELFGWTDRIGTRWKFSVIPLGGYVKMFGDVNPASLPEGEAPAMSAEERAVAFLEKKVLQRAAIVFAGPFANFLLAVILLSILFATIGQQITPPEVTEVVPGSAAEEAGIRPGDEIVRIEGKEVDRFEDIVAVVSERPGEPLDIVVRRGAEEIALTATPRLVEETDRLGTVHRIVRLGVRSANVQFVRHDPTAALWLGIRQTGYYTAETLRAVGQMIAGTRTTEELGGPIRIAQISGQVAQQGLPTLIFFMAILSINLGLINLFPVPMLDGGHLFMYVAEALRGRPLGAKFQEISFRIGFALIMGLIIFVLWNDFKNLGVGEFFRDLF